LPFLLFYWIPFSMEDSFLPFTVCVIDVYVLSACVCTFMSLTDRLWIRGRISKMCKLTKRNENIALVSIRITIVQLDISPVYIIPLCILSLVSIDCMRRLYTSSVRSVSPLSVWGRLSVSLYHLVILLCFNPSKKRLKCHHFMKQS